VRHAGARDSLNRFFIPERSSADDGSLPGRWMVKQDPYGTAAC
jgi:hypothetical protein